MVGAISHILPSVDQTSEIFFVSPYAEAQRVRRDPESSLQGGEDQEKQDAAHVSVGDQNKGRSTLLLYTRQAGLTDNLTGRRGDKQESQESNKSTQGQEEKGEEATLRELRARDREVRQHEQAHKSALGPYAAGGISYTFTTGPDRQQYATGGSVPVDLSKEDSPEATIEKAKTIKRAAYAASESSDKDRQVAAAAQQLEISARLEEAEERDEEESLSDKGALSVTG